MKRISKMFLFCGAIATMLATSCIKDEVGQLGDAGKSFVKINEAPSNALFYRPFTDVRTATLFSLSKEANSSTSLQTASTVKVTYHPELVTAYNTDNSETYKPLLESSIYTLANDASITKAGNDFTFNYAAGDFAKDFKIAIDGSKWDLANKYAAAFVISDPGNLTKKSGTDTIMVFLSSKNKYDGVYEFTGTMTDVAAPTLSHVNVFLGNHGSEYGLGTKMQYELRTISATKCVVYDNYFYGGNYTPISSGDSYSSYGSFSLIVEFDPATDKVVAVTNYYGQPAGNGRYAALDPTGANVYNASSKTINIKYFMFQPSSVPVGPRVSWDETWKYIGER